MDLIYSFISRKNYHFPIINLELESLLSNYSSKFINVYSKLLIISLFLSAIYYLKVVVVSASRSFMASSCIKQFIKIIKLYLMDI